MAVEIDMARGFIKKKAPFFHRMTVKMVFKKSANTQMGTIETTKNAVVFYDEAWFGKFSYRVQAGLIVHEAFHLWHDTFGRRGSREPEMFNTAADMAANCIIRDLGFELPGGDDKGCFPEDILDPATGQPAKSGLAAEEYYEMMKQNRKKSGTLSGKPGDKQGPAGKKPGAGHGKCGSCAGNESGEVDEEDADGRSAGAVARAAKEVSEGIKAAASKGKGNLPASLMRLAEISLAPSEVPWQTELRHSMATSARTTAGNMVRKWDRPSKQQACIGYGSGVAILPRLRAPVPEITVVVDTSGSMGGEELGAAVSEIAAIMKVIGGEVTVMSCDAKVHAKGKVIDPKQILPLLKGGGGTDFRPAFDEMKQNAPDICVFITDGAGTFPSAPPGYTVIWVLAGRYKVPKSQVPFGKVIVVK
jgi:predicted metal-dependent peptidase